MQKLNSTEGQFSNNLITFIYKSAIYEKYCFSHVRTRASRSDSMSGTLIFPHNLQNMTYFVTKFGMRKFCVVP